MRRSSTTVRPDLGNVDIAYNVKPSKIANRLSAKRTKHRSAPLVAAPSMDGLVTSEKPRDR